MLLNEFRSFNKINLSICFNKVVTNRMNIIYDDKLNIFLLHSLLQVEENLVIVFDVFAEVHDDVLSYSLLSHCRLVFY